MDPKKISLTAPATTSMTPKQTPLEALAADVKKRDDELGHRMAMDVLGLQDDPLKAAVEKAVTGRVDVFGKLTKGPGSI